MVLAVRNRDRGADAIETIQEEAPGASVEARPLDVADLRSLRSFAEGLTGPLDLLVNNAGVMAIPYRRTADGFEMQFGTNHLGHFALTGLLLPGLLAAEAPRVVTVSSSAHKPGTMDFDDLQFERRYRRWDAYNRSKLANVLFALELHRRADAAGLSLLSVAAHPGYAATNLQAAAPRMSGNRFQLVIMAIGNRLLAQSAERGALPQLYAATAPDVQGGFYIGPDGGGERRGHPTTVSPNKRALDTAAAARLWEISEELTGVSYGLPAPVGA